MRVVLIIVLAVIAAVLGGIVFVNRNKIWGSQCDTFDLLKDVDNQIKALEQAIASGRYTAEQRAALEAELNTLISLRTTICGYCCAKGGTCEGCNCNNATGRYKIGKDSGGCYILIGGQKWYYDCPA